MNKSESIQNISAAIIEVMRSVKGVEKTLEVGEGKMSYQGVADQEVKKIIGDAMAKNGLSILPVSITPTTKIDRWEETTQYGTKQKQSVFTEVKAKYLLMHTSGEFIEIEGYGHGQDSQDKSAGKATTYALKYTLLYSFLVPTGKIDDADTEHSESKEIPLGFIYTHDMQDYLLQLLDSSTYDSGSKEYSSIRNNINQVKGMTADLYSKIKTGLEANQLPITEKATMNVGDATKATRRVSKIPAA